MLTAFLSQIHFLTSRSAGWSSRSGQSPGSHVTQVIWNCDVSHRGDVPVARDFLVAWEPQF